MRWTPGRGDNIEDRRGARGAIMPIGIGGAVVLLLLSWVTGTNLFTLLENSGVPSETVATNGPVESSPQEDRAVEFVDAVAKDVQTTWSDTLGSAYQPTRVVLFRDVIQSPCGAAESATGPFYCPGDQKVYLDLSFFDELSRRFGAPGDFARAYVVAHEFGHHIQNLLGLTARGGSSGPQSASVAIELQADCLAGIWGHAASQQGQFQIGRVELDPGDAEQALQAAGAIGDDRLQRETTGRVMPERFTHGTSAQRIAAFSRGMQSGSLQACGVPATAH